MQPKLLVTAGFLLLVLGYFTVFPPVHFPLSLADLGLPRLSIKLPEREQATAEPVAAPAPAVAQEPAAGPVPIPERESVAAEVLARPSTVTVAPRLSPRALQTPHIKSMPFAQTPDLPRMGDDSIKGLGGAAREPRYNIKLAPQFPRAGDSPAEPMLQVGVVTTLRLNIGPQQKDSDIRDSVPSTEITGSTVDLALTVILGCEFCTSDAPLQQRLVYRPLEGASDVIEFKFKPQARKDGSDYRNVLHIMIVNELTGRELDQLSIPVGVQAAEASGATMSAQENEALSIPASQQEAGAATLPDVLIFAVTAGDGREVLLTIKPVSALARARLGPLTSDPHGIPKTFNSARFAVDKIDQASVWAFESLGPLNLNDAQLAKLRASGVNAVISEESRASQKFSKGEATSVAEVVAVTGKQLYRTLFSDGPDKSLRKVMTALEKLATDNKAPLRVKIITNTLSLPWQYLHPVAPDVDAHRFWGMRYSLSVIRAIDGGQTWRESAPSTGKRKVLFARYGTSTDESVPFANAQIDSLKQALPTTEIVPVIAGTDLMEQLKTHRSDITGLLTFLHASAGGHASPYLEFGDADKVESADFIKLANNVSEDDLDLRYLSRGPLVVLNACETGPAFELTQTKLQQSIFGLGARGIVVTEVSVWQTLADQIASKLYRRLAKGETAADALTAVRRDLLKENNNPLGLLYAYYGDLSATLQP